MRKMSFLIVIVVGVLVWTALGIQKPPAVSNQPERPAQGPRLQLPATLMGCYLQPPPEFLESHKDEPVEKVYAAYTAYVFTVVLREHTANLQELDKRLKVLEPKVNAPADPNGTK